jgi:hypothetical protein
LAGGIETYRFGRRLSQGRSFKLCREAEQSRLVAEAAKNWVPIGSPAAFQ